MVVDPKYDILHINKELLWSLKYTCNGHQSDDPIPLALVQTYGDSTFQDIFMSQDEVHQVLNEYEASDGAVCVIRRGQHLNFAMAVLYAQYHFA